MVPVIDAFRCDGCKICNKFCPPQIMGTVKDKAVLIADLCEECGICSEVCPVNAVQFELPHHDYKQDHDGYHTLQR